MKTSANGLFLIFLFVSMLFIWICKNEAEVFLFGHAPDFPVDSMRRVFASVLALTPSNLPSTSTRESKQQTPIPTPVPSLTQTPPSMILPDNAREVVELARLGKGTSLSAPLYSPDGKWVAIPTAAGIYIYDAITLEEHHKLPVTKYLKE